MQTIPLGLLGAAAATPLAQRQGETDPVQHDAAIQSRRAAGDKQAENAAGIGQTDHDQPAADRDADGRRIWEIRGDSKQEDEEEPAPLPATAKDPSGQSGTQLDLSG
jgi:hypothetical protein